jgi:hypothetical protein
MNVLTCAATRRRLEAFHDGELPVSDQIAVGSHLEWCDACAATFGELQMLRSVLRAAAPSRIALSPEDDASLQLGVVTRAQAEQSLSFGAVVREMFEDMHFVYAGMGAVAAALVCAVIMLGMMRAVTIDIDPLVAGSNQNPLLLIGGELQMPRAIDEEGFASAPGLDVSDMVFAFTAVVTREGRVANISLLRTDDTGGQAGLEPQRVNELLGLASRARFEPASRAGSPVAVNMVWIVAHTTVRGTKSGLTAPVAPVSRGTRRRSVDLDASELNFSA